MSVKRNVRRASILPSSSFARSSSSFAPRRSNAASAPSSSTVAPCSSPRAADGDAEQHPRLRRLVGRPDSLPLVAREAQAARRAVPVLLRELDPPGGDMDVRVERGSAPLADLVRVDDALELLRGLARRLQVARRDRDLDSGGKRAQPVRAAPRRRQAACVIPATALSTLPSASRSRARPGCGLRPHSFAVAYASSAPAKSPQAAPDLADLVVAAGGDAAVEVAQLLARRHRLLLGRGPVASNAHDLRAVQPAGARKAADVGLVAPAVRGLGPLGGAAEVADVLARADGHAVDHPGRERLVARRRRPRRSPRRAARGPSRPRRSSRARAPSPRARAPGCPGRRCARRARRCCRRARSTSRDRPPPSAP